MDVFITKNNTVYVPNRRSGHVVICSLFVTGTGDIYVVTFASTGGISQWTLNSIVGTPRMSICQ